MTRADALISELAARHGNRDASFLTAVRPLVERILDHGTPAHARVHLLELLAETFERDAQRARDVAAARGRLAEFLLRMRSLLAH